MCYEKKPRYYSCGHYGPSTWKPCDLYPDCGHTVWGIPYDEGGLQIQDDIVIDERCPHHKKSKEKWPDGIAPLPKDER